MALLVHLPLTGDLHNQGLANIEVTNNGATVDNNGKIGKCYSFDGTSKYISLTNPFTDASEISCSIWVKPLTNTSTNEQIMNIGTSSGWSNIRFGILQQSNNQFVFHVSDGTNTISYNCHSEIINVNEWIYIVCTYKNRELKMYLNGELVKTYSISFDPSFSSISKIGIGAAPNGAEKFTGFINDVKIFSHCLSQKEISELKKMLILHYPLDGNNGTLANENLILNGAEANQSPASVNESTFTDYFYYSDYATELMSNNTTDEFTMSYDYEVYGAEPSGSKAVQLYAQCNNTIISNSLIKISSANEKGHVSFTFKLTSTQAQSTFSPFRTRIRLQLAIDGAYIIIKKVKLENGNKATPWCPNPSDALYTALGYNDGIEYDTSGYKNNATGANNLSYSLDSPRYLASAVCNYSNGLTIPKIFSDTCNNQHMSFAFWLKRTADFEVYEEDIYNGIAHIRIRKDYNNNPYRLFISWNHATDDSVNVNTWTMYNTPLDTWVNIVITFDSGLLKMYANGKLIGTSDRTGTGTYIQGNRGMSLGNFTGKLSDFRIYGIALSATDVQNLYEVSASIDSNGNAYSAAYMEG